MSHTKNAYKSKNILGIISNSLWFLFIFLQKYKNTSKVLLLVSEDIKLISLHIAIQRQKTNKTDFSSQKYFPLFS